MMPDGPPNSQRPLSLNPDPSLVSDPLFVLLAWAGGVALAAAAVTLRGIVGPGFTWLASGTVLLIGVWPALAGRGPAAWLGVAGAALGGFTVTLDRRVSGTLLTVSAGSAVVAAAEMAGLPLALTATAALGGITGEMLLGHWYLIDPTLSRWVLRALAIVGLVGVVADGGLVLATLGIPGDAFLAGVAIVLVVTTGGLMAAVVGALRYPAYSGVMAATGLSYLAVLTGLAAVFFGRVLSVGVGPLVS